MIWKNIGLVLCMVLFMSTDGYCLFRDDVSAQQVQSAIRIQRTKDEQRKKQTEQIKAQTTDNKPESQDLTSGPQSNKTVSGLKSAGSSDLKSASSLPQYRRLTPQGTIVDTPQPLAVQQLPTVQKIEKKGANKGFIFLLLVLGIIGVMSFKQGKNKQ